MSVYTTKSRGALVVGSHVLKSASDSAPGSLVIQGKGGSYSSGSVQAYSSVFNFTGNDNLAFAVDQGIGPNFPNGTTFNWSIGALDPRYNGIQGYMQQAFGNYDANAVSLPGGAKQTKNITAMSLNVGWTLTGNGKSGLLCECWLTTSSHVSGAVSSDAVFEVGFFPHCSPNAQAYAAGLTPIGSFVDVNSVTWNVGQGVSGVAAFPYFVATRNSYVDHQGALDFKSYFTFLQNTSTGSRITGNEYFNGVTFGAEIFSVGAASLVINTYTPVYS